jgi:hypothetical protein
VPRRCVVIGVLFSLDNWKVHGNGKDQDALLVHDIDRVSGAVEARLPQLTKDSDYMIKSSLVAWEVDPFGVRLAMIAINDRKEIARQGRSPLNINACGQLRRSLSRPRAYPAVDVQIPLPMAFPDAEPLGAGLLLRCQKFRGRVRCRASAAA